MNFTLWSCSLSVWMRTKLLSFSRSRKSQTTWLEGTQEHQLISHHFWKARKEKRGNLVARSLRAPVIFMPVATVSVLVPPASSSFTRLVKVWAHHSRTRHQLDVSTLGCPVLTSSTCISLANHPALDLLCLPPDTQGSHMRSWNDNFLVAVAFTCGVAHLLANKKITVHLKNSTKVTPFCSLLQDYSILFHGCLVFLALSSHFIALEFILQLAWCIDVNLASRS